MIVMAVVCPLCGDTIYSRARHDFHFCYCGNLFVDGGQEYLRFGAIVDINKIKQLTTEINCDKKQLYDDWNKDINNYGWIRDEKYSDLQRETAKAKVLLTKYPLYPNW